MSSLNAYWHRHLPTALTMRPLAFLLPSPRGTYFTGKSMGVLSPDPSARTYNLTFQLLHKHNEAHKPEGIQKVAVGADSGLAMGTKVEGMQKYW